MCSTFLLQYTFLKHRTLFYLAFFWIQTLFYLIQIKSIPNEYCRCCIYPHHSCFRFSLIAYYKILNCLPRLGKTQVKCAVFESQKTKWLDQCTNPMPTNRSFYNHWIYHGLQSLQKACLSAKRKKNALENPHTAWRKFM